MSLNKAKAVALARRYGPASAAAALINVVAVGLLMLAPTRTRLPPEPAFRVSLIAQARAAKPKAARPRARPLAPRIAASAPHLSQTPAAPPLPIPPGKWTADVSSPAAVRDVPSVLKSVLERDACAKGELWKLSTEMKAKCLDRWGRFKPSEEARLRAPQLRDPHGDFARAAAEAEARRHPFQDAPMGVCDPTSTGSNFGGAGCHSSGKGPLVKRLEGDRR
jgi:hypothetical protein